MYGLYLDDVREQVRRLPTRYVSNTKKKINVVLGLKSRVVTSSMEAHAEIRHEGEVSSEVHWTI
jgi:hypothetical protein